MALRFIKPKTTSLAKPKKAKRAIRASQLTKSKKAPSAASFARAALVTATKKRPLIRRGSSAKSRALGTVGKPAFQSQKMLDPGSVVRGRKLTPVKRLSVIKVLQPLNTKEKAKLISRFGFKEGRAKIKEIQADRKKKLKIINNPKG